ncbi:MAG: MFS transporter [Chitinivibrionales bacterium]|nr:MFS transporter [Chitinivibrionales bacterium]MBD3396304.1 MFS transporter [Chitinivibrionales bacterium]
MPPADCMNKRSFSYFLFVASAQFLAIQIVAFYIALYFKEIGLSGVHTGVYFAISTVAPLLFSLPMGITTDRKSIRWIFVVAFLLMGLRNAGLVLSQSLLVLCAFAFLGSIGGRLGGTAANAMFFKLSGPDNLQSAGLYMFLRSLAMGTGTLLGGYLIDLLSYRTVFAIALGINILLAIMSAFLPQTEQVEIKLAEYRKAVLTPRVLFLAAVFSLSSLHWGAEMVSYTPFLNVNLGLSLRNIGWYTGTGFAFVGIGSILAVVLLKSGAVRDLRRVLVYGLLLSGVFHVLMCMPNVYVSFACRLVHEIGDGFVMVAFYHGIPKVFHLDKIGGCSAFMQLCMGLTAMGSAMLFGHIGDTLGYQWPLIISGIVLVLIPVLLISSRHGMAVE